MARARLILDTRNGSKNIDGSFPVAIKIFHKKPRMIRLSCSTSIAGWDEKNMILKKSALANKNKDCDAINKANYQKLHSAKSMIDELGDTLNKINVDVLVENIKNSWDKKLDSKIKKNLSNGITLNECGQILIDRKLKISKPATASWYKGAISSFTKFNNNKDVKLYQITVTFLKEYEMDRKAKGNCDNAISAYLRAIRAIYNSAVREDRFIPQKNPFHHYKIPTTRRTKKKALSKDKFIAIRNLKYEEGSTLWNTKNYLLSMFNCRGMNLIDLAKLRIRDIVGDRMFYGRSKTGDPFSVKITREFSEILSFYKKDKSDDEFIFPIGYDGSVENFTKYRSDSRLINKSLKIIAKDAGIEERITTYYIRHSWATIAKNLGISTEIISEGLGHHSLRTTEIYLKDFDNQILDDANDMIVF